MLLNRYNVCMLFFLFKQKTAYVMRISDCSSDVCSSDLHGVAESLRMVLAERGLRVGLAREVPHADTPEISRLADAAADHLRGGIGASFGAERSEEHTSELQSLMRISYAVFCLKKKRTSVH